LEPIDIIGFAAAVLGTFCWLPQTLKAWKSGETKDLSLGTNVAILVTMALWLAYGVMLGSVPLIASNIISIVLVGSIVLAKLRFG
jgi:MtN3 and saliva related transmembrane protein